MIQKCPNCGQNPEGPVPEASTVTQCAVCRGASMPSSRIVKARSWRGKFWLRMSAAVMAAALIVVVGLAVSARQQAEMTVIFGSSATLSGTQPPTPFPQFAWYVDAESNFQLQYPQSWEYIQQQPGVEFDDNTQDPNYIVQVLLPNVGPATPSDWVAYELDKLRQTTNASSMSLAKGRQQRQIGGELWESGAATLITGDETLQVQVFATVHAGVVFLINLIVANTNPATAPPQYFEVMLDSFAFLS